MTILGSLYCEETNHQWEQDDDEQDSYTSSCINDNNHNNNNNDNDNIIIHSYDLFWEDQELSCLLSKEMKESHHHSHFHQNHISGAAVDPRREAVEWILEVVSYYSFTGVTAVLAVNYLDRFVDRFEGGLEKPWMSHLAAVSCLSLAAKVEETHVPLLLDLQIEGSKYVFEAKSIQKMEIVILSTLEWKMNPVTPVSFLDYITRRLGLETYISSEFLNRCESLLLCFLPDGRFRNYLPSVIATATMVHVINTLEPCPGIEIEYKSQLLAILGINKEEVEGCWKQIQEIICSRNSGRFFNKRKFGVVPGSPDAVMDLSFSSDESWSVVSPSVSSSPEPEAKKSRKDAA